MSMLTVSSFFKYIFLFYFIFFFFWLKLKTIALHFISKAVAFETLPDLYKFDNYRECMNRSLDTENNYPAKYCMIFVQIQPDHDSLRWHQIAEISNRSKFYFRHDNLFRGLCLENCVNFKGNMENSSTIVNNYLLSSEVNIFKYFKNFFELKRF